MSRVKAFSVFNNKWATHTWCRFGAHVPTTVGTTFFGSETGIIIGAEFYTRSLGTVWHSRACTWFLWEKSKSKIMMAP